jgi:regulator of replication initiation timing
MDIEKILNPDYFALQDSLKEIYTNIKKLEKEAALILQTLKDKKEKLVQEAKSLMLECEKMKSS